MKFLGLGGSPARYRYHYRFPLFYFNHVLKMPLIKSHPHYPFEVKLIKSEKVTFEPFEEEEGTNIKPVLEYHITYHLNIYSRIHVQITFIFINIEKVNKILMKILKNIYKHTFINGHPNEETSSERYKEIIKDSITYTSFKHLFSARHAGQRDGSHLILIH